MVAVYGIIGRMVDKRKVALASVASLIVIIIGGGKLLLTKLNAPHQGMVNSIEAPNANPDAAVESVSAPKTAGGSYASFKYPADMNAQPNSRMLAPVVEQFNFGKRDTESWNFAVAILNEPRGVPSDNAYELRKSKPAIYKETRETVNGHTVVVMKDMSVGGFSEVAFLTHGNYVATVSLYGDDPSGVQPLADAFNQVLSTWQWQ